MPDLAKTAAHYMSDPEPRLGAQSTLIHEVSTLQTMNDRILTTCQTSLSETRERIEAAETSEADLRRQHEDQLIRTLITSQDVMIPARRVYVILTSVTQTYSSLAYAAYSALQDRNTGHPDDYETFFRFQDAFNGMLEDLPASEVLPDSVSSAF